MPVIRWCTILIWFIFLSVSFQGFNSHLSYLICSLDWTVFWIVASGTFPFLSVERAYIPAIVVVNLVALWMNLQQCSKSCSWMSAADQAGQWCELSSWESSLITSCEYDSCRMYFDLFISGWRKYFGHGMIVKACMSLVLIGVTKRWLKLVHVGHTIQISRKFPSSPDGAGNDICLISGQEWGSIA